MQYKCIYTHISQEFMTWRHILATQTSMDTCGPQHVYALDGPISHYSLCFSFLITIPKILPHPHIIDTCMPDFNHYHSIMYDKTPYILLFIPHSPIVCMDFFSLVYIDTCMTDFNNYHSIMYNKTPYILLFTSHFSIVCMDFFSLVYLYKLSTYYAVTCINLGPIFPWSTLSKVLKLAPLQPSSILATIASDFLDYLLSPLIAIHICFIFTQD